MEFLKQQMPLWAQDGLVVLEIGVIVLLAWVLRRGFRKLSDKLVQRHNMPIDILVPLNTIVGWVIFVAALLMVLERVGVSGQVLWTAITGFTAVAAVAFFAAWSVLSNTFCAFLIFTTQPFKIGDELEILDASDKIGIHGRVISIHLLYTVLQEIGREDGRYTLVQVPNSAFFQKTIRRWKNGNDMNPSI